MNRPSRYRPCARCHQTRYIHGRGLCPSCYETARDNGTIDDYATTRPNRIDDIVRLAREGLTHREIGERLGIGRNAVQLAYSRARRSGALDAVAKDSTPTPRPAEPTPCAGVDTELFVYRWSFDGRLTAPQQQRAREALTYCARCPLASRQWCMDLMRPREGGFTGVVGGVAWAMSRPVNVAPVEVAS